MKKKQHKISAALANSAIWGKTLVITFKKAIYNLEALSETGSEQTLEKAETHSDNNPQCQQSLAFKVEVET